MASRLQILHGIGALVAGGAERAAVDLAIAQKRSGLAPEIVCTTRRMDDVGQHWRNLLGEAEVPVHRAPSSRFGPSAVLWLNDRLKVLRGGIFHIHLNYVEAAYYLARFLHKRRYGVLRKLHNMEMTRSGLIGWAQRHSDVRVSVAPGTATYERFAGVLKGKQFCVPNGMNFFWPVYDPSRKGSAQQRLRLRGDCRHVLCVGSLSGSSVSGCQKAQDILIKAWRAHDLGERLGAELHILGDGNLRGPLENLARQDRTIVFHGVQPGIDQWLQATDVFVLPSRYEGLPNAGIEAVGTGVPCVFSDIRPCRELATPAVKFVPPNDVVKLAAAIEHQLLSPPPVDLAAVAAIRSRYGIDATVRGYNKVYACDKVNQ